MKKAIRILLILSVVLLTVNNYTYATYIDTEISIGNSGAISSNVEMTEKLLGAFQLIGSIISILALVIIGFRYMFSSVEEQAKMKGVLIYYIVGAVLVFATSNVLSLAYRVISGLTL